MFLNSTCPSEGQLSGDSNPKGSVSSLGVISSSVFKRAMAPSEVSNVVQFSTSFSNVELVTSIMLSTIPTCAPLTCPRNATAIAMSDVAMAAARRSRITFNHLWRHKRINSGRCELSMHCMLSCIAALDQPNDRIVSRPSIYAYMLVAKCSPGVRYTYRFQEARENLCPGL
jgi:hypothetical protein